MFTYNTRISLALAPICVGLALVTHDACAQTREKQDEIIVTGSMLSATSNENLAGVSVLTNEKLQQRMSGSLGETLKFEPGISSSFFGTGASRPIIRGQGGLRVLLLDNGIGSVDASSASPDHAAAVEPAMANRIEIIRGSGLLRYGSAASGGVINVIDGRIPEHVPESTIIGNTRLGVSSVDDGYETAVGSDIHLGPLGSGDMVAHVEHTHRATQNYNIPNFARSKNLRAREPIQPNTEVKDTLPNSATRATSLAAGISYIGDERFIGVAIKDLNSAYGIPGGEGSSIKLVQTRYDLHSSFRLENGVFERLTLSGGIGNYVHQEREASGEIGTVFRNKGFETRLEIFQKQRGAWQSAHGIQYKKREFSAIGEEAFVPPTTTNSLGIFSFHEYDFGRFHLEGAARYEHVKHEDDTNNTINFNSLSGSIGADYHLTDTTKFGGTLFRTRRAPTTEELFSNGPHLATNQFEIGDPNLDNEIAAGIEFSLRYKKNDNHITINAFYTDYTGYIFEALTGGTRTTDEGDILSIARFTTSDAVFKGFEIVLGKDLGRWNNLDVQTEASLEYVNARLSSAKTGALPRIPPLGATLAISANNDSWNLRAELEYATDQNQTAFGELPTEGYVLFNTFATYHINDNVTLRLSAHNLTNQDARQHTSFLKEDVPLPGRNFKTNLSLKF